MYMYQRWGMKFLRRSRNSSSTVIETTRVQSTHPFIPQSYLPSDMEETLKPQDEYVIQPMAVINKVWYTENKPIKEPYKVIVYYKATLVCDTCQQHFEQWPEQDAKKVDECSCGGQITDLTNVNISLSSVPEL